MRVKAADMEAMGMSKPEMARMKKALKKLRKEARELAAAQAAAASVAAENKAVRGVCIAIK